MRWETLFLDNEYNLKYKLILNTADFCVYSCDHSAALMNARNCTVQEFASP